MALSPENRDALGRAIGVGLIAVGAFDGMSGPLGWMAVVTATSLFSASALARTDWHEAPHPVARELAFIAVLFSGAATITNLPAPLAAGLAVCIGVTSSFSMAVTVASIVAAAVVPTVALTLLAKTGVPWEVLDAPLDTVHLGSAVGAGALIGWAPTVWSAAAEPDPGRHDLPVATAGLGLLVCMAWMLGSTTSYLGLEGLPWMLGLACLAGTAALLGGPGHDHRLRFAALVVAGIGWAAFNLDGLAAVWWQTSLPAMLGLAAMAQAWHWRRPFPGVLGAAFVCAGLMAWPGLPDTPWVAALAALPWVVAVWWGGLR